MQLENGVLTTKEAAEYLKINSQVLEKYLRKGTVPGKKVGRLWRINKLALDLWLAPSLVSLLPKTFAWQEIFSLGERLDPKKTFSDKDILKMVKDIRRNRGITLKSRL